MVGGTRPPIQRQGALADMRYKARGPEQVNDQSSRRELIASILRLSARHDTSKIACLRNKCGGPGSRPHPRVQRPSLHTSLRSTPRSQRITGSKDVKAGLHIPWHQVELNQ